MNEFGFHLKQKCMKCENVCKQKHIFQTTETNVKTGDVKHWELCSEECLGKVLQSIKNKDDEINQLCKKELCLEISMQKQAIAAIKQKNIANLEKLAVTQAYLDRLNAKP